jgi:hypothetical protein
LAKQVLRDESGYHPESDVSNDLGFPGGGWDGTTKVLTQFSQTSIEFCPGGQIVGASQLRQRGSALASLDEGRLDVGGFGDCEIFG